MQRLLNMYTPVIQLLPSKRKEGVSCEKCLDPDKWGDGEQLLLTLPFQWAPRTAGRAGVRDVTPHTDMSADENIPSVSMTTCTIPSETWRWHGYGDERDQRAVLYPASFDGANQWDRLYDPWSRNAAIKLSSIFSTLSRRGYNLIISSHQTISSWQRGFGARYQFPQNGIYVFITSAKILEEGTFSSLDQDVVWPELTISTLKAHVADARECLEEKAILNGRTPKYCGQLSLFISDVGSHGDKDAGRSNANSSDFNIILLSLALPLPFLVRVLKSWNNAVVSLIKHKSKVK